MFTLICIFCLTFYLFICAKLLISLVYLLMSRYCQLCLMWVRTTRSYSMIDFVSSLTLNFLISYVSFAYCLVLVLIPSPGLVSVILLHILAFSYFMY